MLVKTRDYCFCCCKIVDVVERMMCLEICRMNPGRLASVGVCVRNVVSRDMNDAVC